MKVTKQFLISKKKKVEDDQTPDVPGIFNEWKKAGGISMVNSNLAYQDISTSEVPQIKDDPVKWCSVSLSDVIKRGYAIGSKRF